MKIDLEKLLCALITYNSIGTKYRWLADDIKSALKEQGLEYKDGEIVEIKKEPKFKVGDWAVSNLDEKARQISEVHFDEYNSYYVVDGKSVNLEEYDRLHHLWTIQDAKDGDVLVVPPIIGCEHTEQIFIFKEIKDRDYVNNAVEYYCRYIDNIFIINKQGFMGTSKDCFTPATKEQCDLLFSKMKEAGYEWDAEKKELKLLITNGGDFDTKNCERNPAWGYEDEANLNNIIWLCNNCIKGSETTWIPSQAKKIKHLIETIKEIGLVQQTSAWGEEDEKILNTTISFLSEYAAKGYENAVMCMDWLKSLKERIG